MVLGLLWVISVGGSVGMKVDDTATTLEPRGTLPPPRRPWPKPWVSCMVSLLSPPQTNRGSAFLPTLQPSLASVSPVPHSSGLVTLLPAPPTGPSLWSDGALCRTDSTLIHQGTICGLVVLGLSPASSSSVSASLSPGSTSTHCCPPALILPRPVPQPQPAPGRTGPDLSACPAGHGPWWGLQLFCTRSSQTSCAWAMSELRGARLQSALS